jgi:hypothetical protein
MTRYFQFSAIPVLALVIATLCATSSCKKSSSGPSTPAEATIIQDTITVESIIAATPDDQDVDPTRTGWIDLYDGTVYTQSEASTRSSDIDFAYNYHGGGCSNCRFFESVTSMSTRTGYVSSFSNITNSTGINAAYYNHITEGEFDSIRTAANIDTLFVTHNITANDGDVYITDSQNDVSQGNVIAFIDKNGRKGFMKIGDYVANVPDGDPAPLTLTVKIQK